VVAETERLVIRCPRFEDDEALFEAVSTSRKALLPWLPWAAAEHQSVAQSRRFLELMAQDRSAAELTNLVLFIVEREGGALVGGTGYHRLDRDHACAEIGYWIRADRRRRGYCREAVAGLITTAFTTFGLRRIRICCAAPNLGSRAVIDRLGLRLESRERLERFVPGHGWVDSVAFGVLPQEWSAELGRVTRPLPPPTD
jgi:RimJ/RimL family protein N-acetyltransferase